MSCWAKLAGQLGFEPVDGVMCQVFSPMLLGQALFLVKPTSASWLMICSVTKGVGMSAIHGTLFAMIADTIEYGQWKNGTRVEGILYSSTTFGAKVGVGVAAAIALSVIGAAGYDGLAAVQTGSGKLKGYIFDGIHIFKGVPYAEAERFQMPKPGPAWEGVREATIQH